MSAKHVARGEARKLVCTLMDEEDLMQEGCIGLLRAAKRFDASREFASLPMLAGGFVLK